MLGALSFHRRPGKGSLRQGAALGAVFDHSPTVPAMVHPGTEVWDAG